ncbi:MAG: ribonuclease Z [Candidatus Odinarchaeum yellowstonii]|uniref:Ribonuclease Z n=1 Tax=Odinarchaeota yellowstonii (strain LCB_4) TaxID=1841599 RepID=A0AAF0D2Y9_ODILC|nr:MAG: ribonuclease Z [Candidatus Odinarchaeum yellowstonii]
MEVIFLGTSGGMPTVERLGPAIALRKNGEIILLDCGEGAQIQMQKAGLSVVKIRTILLSHLHGDHVAGLPGMLMTMGLLNKNKPLRIIGPLGVFKFVHCLKETVKLGITYPIQIIELKDEIEEVQLENIKIKAVKAFHKDILAYSYILEERSRPGRFDPEKAMLLGVPEGELWGRLQAGEKIVLNNITVTPQQVLGPPRKGLKIVYTGDTRPNPKLEELSFEADMLIHESTFNEEHYDKAQEYGHSTAVEAAKTARQASVKKLVLFHISPRYTDTNVMLENAKKYFENTIIATDLLRIVVPYQD